MAGIRRADGSIAFASPAVLALAAYALIVLLLLPQYMSFYYKDEISYVAAAERYARGDFVAAPNSLWGPLISWLVALALKFGMTSIVAARTVTLILGGATLYSAARLAKTLKLPEHLQLIYLLTLVPYIVYFAVYYVTDDLALTALLIFYFSVIFDPRYADRRNAGFLCGLLGGVAYYAKGYALGFFLVHFTLSSLLHLVAKREGQDRREVLKHMAAGLSVFAILAALWVAVLYQKYHVVTFGITGQYNYQIVGPEAKDRPALYIGFTRPPDVTTVSIWEDPAFFYRLPQARACCLKPWTPFDSLSAFRHQIGLFRLNLGRTLLVFLKYSLLSFAVGLAGILYCFGSLWPAKQRKNRPVADKVSRPASGTFLTRIRDALGTDERLTAALALMTMIIYPIPYTLVFSDERFFWPILILVVGFGLKLLNIFFNNRTLPRRAEVALVGLFVISFLPFPLRKLTASHAPRDATASFARQLKDAHVSGIRFASNTDYGASVCVGYEIRSKYYGQAAPGMSGPKIAEELRRYGIQYYFVWDTPGVSRPGMKLLRIFKAEWRTLAIYRVDP